MPSSSSGLFPPPNVGTVPEALRRTGARIRVLICDDRMAVREELKRSLSGAADVVVIDEADNGADCVRLAQWWRPDVVLLDLALIGRDGLDTLADLKRARPQLPVLMLSTYPERQYAMRCLQLGAAGYLHKSVDAAELAQAVRAVAAGALHITPAVAEALNRRPPGPLPFHPLNGA